MAAAPSAVEPPPKTEPAPLVPDEPAPVSKDQPPADPPRIEPKTDPATETKVEPPAKPPEPKKTAVPDPVQLAEAEKRIRKTFADDFAKTKLADQAALAGQLLDEAIKTKDDAVARFALLQLTSETAARGGDFNLALRAIDAIDQEYEIDAPARKTKLLRDASQVQQLPVYFRALTDAALELAEENVAADHYPAANQLLGIAEAASRRANSPQHQNRAQTRGREVAEITKEYEKAKSAAAKLQTDAEDAAASAAWGRFLACYKGNWGGGLVLLAQGSDPSLKELAAQDLARPTDVEDQLRIGDGWWKLGESATGVRKKQLWIRAKHWYDQVASQLQGFSKTRVEANLKEIDKLLPKEEATAERPSTTTVPGVVSPVKLAYDRQISAGLVAQRNGSFEKAVEAFREALRLMPGDPRATQYLRQARYLMHFNRATYLFNLRRYGDAIKEYEAALEAAPGDLRAQAGLREAQGRDFRRRFNRDKE
jgi:tetratricopeptide (TPR) repeat protein